MSNHTRFQYWQDQLERNKLGVLSRLIEYEAEIDRYQAQPDGKQRRAAIQEILENADTQKNVLDGLDSAIIGLAEDDMTVIYSKKWIFEALREFCKTHLEALDYYEFNVVSTASSLGIIIVDDTIF